MIAEDDGDLRTVLSILLMTEGWEVADAGTFEEARALLADDPPELLVLDLQLADHVAGELLAELACRSDAPVTVLVSGHDEIQPLAHRYGVAYARKPVDVEVLMSTIDRALSQERRPSLGALRATWGSLRSSTPSLA